MQWGTCDFTTLTKDHHRNLNLDIVSEGGISHSAVSIRSFEKIVEIARSKHVNVTLIEIPFFSIKRWNIRRRHPRPHIFEMQDRNLNATIRSVNEHIHRINKLNRLNRIQSPLLNIDLETRRKNRRYYNYYNLYIDGLHPVDVLNKCWLRKIAIQIRRDFY